MSGWDGMGQTWSSPKVLKTAGLWRRHHADADHGRRLRGRLRGRRPDDLHQSAGKGGRIYVLDADTGTKLKEFDISS